jgi:hypothetical protein
MSGLSLLTAVWQTMHLDSAGRPAVNPGSSMGWQKAHFKPAAIWTLWLKGMG